MNSNGKWEAKTLREVSIQFGRGRSKHRPRNDKKLYNGEYPFIQTGDIRNATHIIRTYSQTYNELGLAQSKLWPKGTICITIAANIAETSILGFDACFPDSVIGLTVKPDLADANFTEYLLQFYKSRIKLKGKGSAQANINMETFENEKFLFPTVQEQRLIAKNLDQLSDRHKRLEEIYKQKLSALDEFKKSILQKAFAGELIESTESKVKPFEVQQAIGAILRNDFERGEMITAKVLYLSQEIYGVPLNIPFTAQNFGPYDPHIKKAITAGLMKHNKFFKKKHTNNGDVFALDQGSQKLFKYQSQVLVKMNEALSDLMKYIKSADSPSIERLATVCKIIQDNRTTNLSIVWGKMKEWKGNKFTEEQVSRSLHFIVEHKWDIVLLKKHE